MAFVWLLLLARANAADPLDFTAATLPAENLSTYNVDISQSSVSGLSAGAYMADQFFVAFSKDMLGLGVFAGGPYGCSDGNLVSALGRCMNPTVFNRLNSAALQQLHTRAEQYANQGLIDALDHLHTKKVYIYSGTLDTTVQPEVTAWVDDWYAMAGIEPEHIVFKNDLEAPHGLPTMDYGNPCQASGNPWMNDCDYDGAGAALAHILGPLHPPRPTAELSGRFVKFYQNEFFDPQNLTAEELKNRFSMNEFGFAYVPRACADGEPCRAHIVFHGCKQVYNRNPDALDYASDDASSPFGLQYVKYAGYNEWADTNNLIMLYPQAQKAQFMNPRGCYDWWGYLPGTTDTYATKQGPQMKAVYAMLQRISSGGSGCQGPNQPPTIILEGPERIELDIGDLLLLPDPEATAVDPEEGDITPGIIRTPAETPDTRQPGIYLIRYNVQDAQGCKAPQVLRTVIVGGCAQWTTTNQIHAQMQRAFSQWCFYFFFPYKCYSAVGSNDALGSGSDITTLVRPDATATYFELGNCP